MNVCEPCGSALVRKRNPFLRCARCGLENDDRRYEFGCAEEANGACDWCEERMCR